MSSAADTHALNARLLRFRSHPEQEDAHALAEDLIAARRFGDARGVAVSAQTDDGPSDARLLVLEARAWYLDRDLVRAQAALVRAARLDPQCAEAFRWMGEVLLKRGDPLRAQRALERANELMPGDRDAERLLERARQLARHAPEEVVEAMPAPAPSRQPTPQAFPAPPQQASTSTPGEFAAPLLPPRPLAGAFTPRATPHDAEAPPGAAGAFVDERTTTYRPSSAPGALAPVALPDTVPGVRSSAGARSAAGTGSAPGRSSPGTSSTAGLRSSPGTSSAAGMRSSPGTGSAPGRSSPGTGSAAGLRSSPGTNSAAGTRSSPGASSAAGLRSSPGTSSAAGTRSSPGTGSAAGLRSSPGTSSAAGLHSSAGTSSAPGTRSSPGASSAAGTRSSPGTGSAAGLRSSPGTSSAAGTRSSPGTGSAAGLRSSPGASSAAGTRSSPGTSSAAGLRSAPGRTAPGSRTAPGASSGFDDLSGGELDAEFQPSRPGTLSSPLTYAEEHEVPAAEARRTGSGTLPAPAPPPPAPEPLPLPGAWAAPAPAALPASVDVDIDEPEVEAEPDRYEPAAHAAAARARASLPSIGGLFGGKREPGSSTSWEAPSVVAMWPSMESLSEPPPPPPPPMRGRTPVDLPAEHAEGTLYGDETAYDEAERAEPTSDLPLGETADQPDDPLRLIESLREQGIFEAEDDSVPPPTWTQASEVPRTGTRLGRTLFGVWLVSLLLFGAGYVGWQQWIAHRHGTAAELVAEAKAAAFESDHARLVDAERLLRQARDNHPRSKHIPAGELFVHAQRVLENGSRDLSSLRAAASRAERLGADPAHLAVARALLAVYSGAPAEAQQLLAKAIPAAKGEPALLYVVGRLQQRLGLAEEASAHLRAAAAAAPDLIAASLALAELHHERGETQEALARLDAVLRQRPQHLRAKLWRAFLTADEQDPASTLRTLDALTKDARASAPIDRILWALSRARLLRRTGQQDAAGEALREAAAAGASEPRLLALVATDARRAGQLGVAQQAASQALAAAPESAAYRALLAGILLERSDGERALRLLAELPQDEPTLITMRARAALQTGDEPALRSVLQAIEARSAAGPQDGETAALRLRVRAALEPKEALLQEARALLRRAPADPEALRATGEVALALREPAEAVRAFEQLGKLMAQDAEAQYLLGRARRMAADAKGAEQALRRALELSPGYVAALAALGGLLLDGGKYAEADALYQQLSAHEALPGRLGRAEALIGLGRLDDAQVQVTGVTEDQRQSAPVREVAAKLALARRKPGEALTQLRPLIEGEDRKAPALALYGDALYAAEQVNAAAGAYDAALELDSQLPEALLGRANVHLRAARPGEALDLLERARAALEGRLRAPEVRARLLALLGHAYVQREKRGDYDRARDALRQAVRLPNPPTEAYFFLGESLGGKRTTEAAEAFKRYLELEPKGDYAERARRALGPLL